MNNSGEAAEQVVRMYLEGVEVVAKLTGTGAKNVAALLMSVLKQEHKTKGKARLTSMLKSGKPLKVFSIPQKDLKTFMEHAKRYGVLYNVLRDRTNSSPTADVDIIVREEDASKIQRIVDRFSLGTVDKAAIVNEEEKDKADREAVTKDVPKKSRGQRVYEEAMSAPTQKEKNAHENPMAAQTEKSPPSEKRYEQRGTRTDQGRAKSDSERKPSVRAELERYKKQNRKLSEQERTKTPPQQGYKSKNGQTVHKQPRKTKPRKER